jgi:hypothetical protein
MFYSHPCSYCNKIFYTFTDSKEQAAKILFDGIKQHLIEYQEDDKESEFDHGPEIGTNDVYSTMTETKDRPTGGYELS